MSKWWTDRHTNHCLASPLAVQTHNRPVTLINKKEKTHVISDFPACGQGGEQHWLAHPIFTETTVSPTVVFLCVSLSTWIYYMCISNVCQDLVSLFLLTNSILQCIQYTTTNTITSQQYPLHDMTYFNSTQVFTTGNRCKHFSVWTALHIALGLLRAHILL